MMLNNRLLRILQNKKRFSNTLELYASFNTLPINNLFIFRLLIHAHALHNKSESLPMIFHNKVQLNSSFHSYSTRSNNDFHILQTNTKAGSKLSYHIASIHWNSLPSEIKKIQSVILFKKSAKNFLLNNY